MNIISEIPGVVDEIFVEDGTLVENGQRLLKINSSQQQEAYLLSKQKVIETQLEMEQAQKDLERLEGLYRLNQIPEKEVDELKQKLHGLREVLIINQQLLTLQKSKIEKATIRAPMAGMVLFAWPIEKGILINPGQQLLSVIEGVNIEAYLNQDDALKVKIGQRAFIKNLVVNANDSLAQGAICFISPEIKRGMVKVIIHPDENIRMALGSSIEARFPVSSPHRTLVVPIESVGIVEGKTCLFTVEDGIVKKRKVVIGENNHQFVEIIRGDRLTEGSAIIVSHFEEIREEMKFEFQKDW
jgi:RND family efflux transporter MFP subunit